MQSTCVRAQLMMPSPARVRVLAECVCEREGEGMPATPAVVRREWRRQRSARDAASVAVAAAISLPPGATMVVAQDAAAGTTSSKGHARDCVVRRARSVALG